MIFREKKTVLETMDVTNFINTLKGTLFKALSPMVDDTLNILDIHSPEDLEKFTIEMGHKEKDIIKMWFEGRIFDPVFMVISETDRDEP